MFDTNGDGFVSFVEFSNGMDKIIELSQPIKEKLFAMMDKSKMGLVDKETFIQVIQMTGATR